MFLSILFYIIAFVADDGDANDGNTHMWQADSLSNYVADNYSDINITKIYLDVRSRKTQLKWFSR